MMLFKCGKKELTDHKLTSLPIFLPVTYMKVSWEVPLSVQFPFLTNKRTYLVYCCHHYWYIVSLE